MRHCLGQIHAREVEASDGRLEEEELARAALSGPVRLHDPKQDLQRMENKIEYQSQGEEAAGAR